MIYKSQFLKNQILIKFEYSYFKLYNLNNFNNFNNLNNLIILI